MNIFSIKPGHDGTIALLEDTTLAFSFEAEKDSFPRYSDMTANVLLDALSYTNNIPDVFAISGYVKYLNKLTLPLGAGYFGVDPNQIIARKETFLGKKIDFFSSSHERSHILCAYALSHLPQGEPCYVLVWEGLIGSFYEIDPSLNIHHVGQALASPGIKYSFIYAIANPDITSVRGRFRFSDAGKLMALTSFSKRLPLTLEDQKLIDYIIHFDDILFKLEKENFKNSSIYNVGVESDAFKNFSGHFSDSIFNVFYTFAKSKLKNKWPLLISGGCGLNCDWNTKWKNSGLFSDVFVPPVPNDSGSAIGTAVDALFYYTGKAKLDWQVYTGKLFEEDPISENLLENVEIFELNYQQVAHFLNNGKVIGWVQGRMEMGPRALGNRSILASPFTKEMHERINRIKGRERYRPIAPICIEEDASLYFDWTGSSPYMLYFQELKSNALKAITHVDNSARMLTVNAIQNKEIYLLLNAFKKMSGFGVLCNTSLNFNGMGFINKTSDLFEYGKKHHLDGFVIHNRFYVFKNESS